jgi:hypothetical protein
MRSKPDKHDDVLEPGEVESTVLRLPKA